MSESVFDRELNLIGAFALAVADAQRSAGEQDLDHVAAAPAALIAVAKYPHESVTFFAPILGLTGSGTVRLFERLAAAGLVQRQPGPDGRTLALALTSSGRRATQRITRARRQAVAHILAPLSDSERRQLTALLETVLPALPQDRTAARHLCRLCDHAACDAAGECPIDLAVTAAGHASYEEERQATPKERGKPRLANAPREGRQRRIRHRGE